MHVTCNGRVISETSGTAAVSANQNANPAVMAVAVIVTTTVQLFK